jgi:hypothetical protein
LAARATSDESREFLAALEGLMDSFQREQRSVLRRWKLTPLQLFVLRWLSKYEDANMSNLAEFDPRR